MSKSVSFRDLKKIPEFKEVKELYLAHPQMDNVLEPYLFALGIDTTQPVEYVANNHRDMSNQIGIGIRAVGEIRRDKEFKDSPFCDLIDRIVIAGIKDPSLAEEMENLTRQVSNAVEASDDDSNIGEVIEDDYEISAMEIDAINAYIAGVRGGSNIVEFVV